MFRISFSFYFKRFVFLLLELIKLVKTIFGNFRIFPKDYLPIEKSFAMANNISFFEIFLNPLIISYQLIYNNLFFPMKTKTYGRSKIHPFFNK